MLLAPSYKKRKPGHIRSSVSIFPLVPVPQKNSVQDKQPLLSVKQHSNIPHPNIRSKMTHTHTHTHEHYEVSDSSVIFHELVKRPIVCYVKSPTLMPFMTCLSWHANTSDAWSPYSRHSTLFLSHAGLGHNTFDISSLERERWGKWETEDEYIPIAALSPPEWLLHQDGQRWEPMFH